MDDEYDTEVAEFGSVQANVSDEVEELVSGTVETRGDVEEDDSGKMSPQVTQSTDPKLTSMSCQTTISQKPKKKSRKKKAPTGNKHGLSIVK